MKFTYEDLISGDSIYVQGLGHFRSPLLEEIKPTKGIGAWTYNLYLNLLSWDKNEYLSFFKETIGRRAKILSKNEKLGVFDMVTVIESSRELLQKAMAFFMDEKLSWDEKERAFYTSSKTDEELVGRIDRNNFEEVRDMMLQMNYINVGESAKPLKHSSAAAQELWERAQQYLKEESTKATPDKNMNLGNIISKLCAANTGYTLLNIYNLTVFQLYDQFFQYGYLRAMNLNEMAFSNHGGKDFDMRAWLKPIIKI